MKLNCSRSLCNSLLYLNKLFHKGQQYKNNKPHNILTKYFRIVGYRISKEICALIWKTLQQNPILCFYLTRDNLNPFPISSVIVVHVRTITLKELIKLEFVFRRLLHSMASLNKPQLYV